SKSSPPRSTFKLLSKVVFALFLPCLIFTELGESITLENMAKGRFIPVNVLISTTIISYSEFWWWLYAVRSRSSIDSQLS
ncbi:Protein PIN-LIKES 2, partial [Linum grandiflorum]